MLISVSRLQGYPWVTPGAFSDSTGADGDGEGDFAQSNRTNNKSKNEATAGIDEWVPFLPPCAVLRKGSLGGN